MTGERKAHLSPTSEKGKRPALAGRFFHARNADKRRAPVFAGAILFFLGGSDAAPELPQHRLEFLRQGAGELHRLPGAGMEESQPHRMEALALEAGDRLFGAVHRVPQDGMADMGHVDSDLVGASGLQAAAHMGVARIPGDDFPVGDGAASPGDNRHLFPVAGTAADGGVHRALVFPEIAYHHALIGPGQSVVLELSGKLLVGKVVFSGDDETGGVPVDAVNNTWSQGSADAGEGISTVMEQGVDQRTVGVAGGGGY